MRRARERAGQAGSSRKVTGHRKVRELAAARGWSTFAVCIEGDPGYASGWPRTGSNLCSWRRKGLAAFLPRHRGRSKGDLVSEVAALKHGCARVRIAEPRRGRRGGTTESSEAVPGWEYARLRFDLVRMARQIAGPGAADDLVQRVFLHVARSGPAAPRDARGLPRPAYLASVLYALAGTEEGQRRVVDDALWNGTGHTEEHASPEFLGARGG